MKHSGIKHKWFELNKHSTQCRTFRGWYSYRSDDPTSSVRALMEGG